MGNRGDNLEGRQALATWKKEKKERDYRFDAMHWETELGTGVAAVLVVVYLPSIVHLEIRSHT
jgi:hypothetical protein